MASEISPTDINVSGNYNTLIKDFHELEKRVKAIEEFLKKGGCG